MLFEKEKGFTLTDSVSTPSLVSCVILGKPLHLSEAQFLTHKMGLVRAPPINTIMCVQHPAHSRASARANHLPLQLTLTSHIQAPALLILSLEF